MRFSFGIITNGKEDSRIIKVIESIKALNIDKNNYEIIIVGGDKSFQEYEKIIHVPFDERIKTMWITKKKNLITEKANFENVVYSHDYIVFDENWYQSFLDFGEDWDLCMNQIINFDGNRYRDWTFFPHFLRKFLTEDIRSKMFEGGKFLIPYNVLNKNLYPYMYISGAYWVGKKEFMLQNPLDENLRWGEGEDVKWSEQIFSPNKNTKYLMNKDSIIKIIKEKPTIFFELDNQEYIELIKNY